MWSDKYKNKARKRKVITPGGSHVIRHPDITPKPRAFGFLRKSVDERREKREKLYEKMFGKIESVYHEMVPMVPHVDVYVFAPKRGRPFCTLVTGGMSDLRMKVPHELRRKHSRAELLLYARESKKEYVDLLHHFAVFPHEYKTWVSHGDTATNGVPPKPLFRKSGLSCILFINAWASPEKRVSRLLKIDGDPVRFLQVFPITERECNLKLEKGLYALFAALNKKDVDFILNEQRRSVV
jgi:hypothetical protein